MRLCDPPDNGETQAVAPDKAGYVDAHETQLRARRINAGDGQQLSQQMRDALQAVLQSPRESSPLSKLRRAKHQVRLCGDRGQRRPQFVGRIRKKAPFGNAGYVALFEIDDPSHVSILAVRRQREEDCH